MDTGFVQGQSDNLPVIDSMMQAAFLKNLDFVSSEIRGVKGARSTRENYVDNAIGYVQLKREGGVCYIKAKITPEHKIRVKPYNVSMCVDEEEGLVKSCECHDCPASAGGCKHAIAFLSWVHRKSMEPSRTDVECYWKKSKMSGIGTTKKYVQSFEIGCTKNSQPTASNSHEILNAVVSKTLELGVGDNIQLMAYFKTKKSVESLTLYNLLADFNEEDATSFIQYCKTKMNPVLCKDVENLTKGQSDNAHWHKQRYGRITASKLYEAAHCHTFDGSLVETILGAKIITTYAINRGIKLEKLVIRELEKVTKKKYANSGIIISPLYPIFGASPDGVCSEHIVEIKCPTSIRRMDTFLKNGHPSPKYYAQMQLQMLLAGKKFGVYCVAHPDFEVTKNIEVCNVTLDLTFTEELMNKAQVFWNEAVFPKLLLSKNSSIPESLL